MSFHDLTHGQRVRIVAQGTDHFAGQLAALTDRDLGAPSLLDGWTRGHLVAHLAFNAIALCRLLDWAATGVESPMYTSAAARNTEIEDGARLPVWEQRELFAHHTAQLAQKWEQLPEAAWTAMVRTAQGRSVPASETLWMRTREVWIHAVDLAGGATFSAVPKVVQSTLVDEIAAGWQQQGWEVAVDKGAADRASVTIVRPEQRQPSQVSGPLSAVLRWMSGRGALGVSPSAPAAPPRWL